MTVELTPETERLVKEEIELGHFRSVDEVINSAVETLRIRYRGATGTTRKTPAEAIAHIRQLREGVSLAGLKIKDLMNEGRP